MKLLQLDQGSLEWLTWRRGGVGGSDAAAILGVSPFPDATRERVFGEKIGLGPALESNYATRRGTRLEPIARSLYEVRAGCHAPPVCVEHDDAPWMRVSLDGLCADRLGETPTPWVLELKCPNWKVHELALAGIVVDYYRPQCQWQLLVTGLERLDFVSFNDGRRFREGDQLAVVPVAADAELQGLLLYECERFWREVEASKSGRPVAVA